MDLNGGISMTRLLALDQSSRVSGYAIFQTGTLEKYGKWNFTDADMITRVIKLRDAARELIAAENIEEVAIEEIQLQANTNNVVTFKVLASVQAAILILCNDLSLPCKVVPSSTWKSACGVKGRARAEQKQNAQKFVKEEFNVVAIQDICDAICIGYAVIKDERGRIDWE